MDHKTFIKNAAGAARRNALSDGAPRGTQHRMLQEKNLIGVSKTLRLAVVAAAALQALLVSGRAGAQPIMVDQGTQWTRLASDLFYSQDSIAAPRSLMHRLYLPISIARWVLC